MSLSSTVRNAVRKWEDLSLVRITSNERSELVTFILEALKVKRDKKEESLQNTNPEDVY